MPSENTHITIAKHNQATIEYLLPKINEHSDWITTIAFYRALHIVEAIFFRNSKILHGHNHETRDHHLKSNRRYSHIYKHYRPLWAASTIARYLEKDGDVYTSFSEYLPSEMVKTEILGHRLHQIEISAKKFLSAESQKNL